MDCKNIKCVSSVLVRPTREYPWGFSDITGGMEVFKKNNDKFIFVTDNNGLGDIDVKQYPSVRNNEIVIWVSGIVQKSPPFKGTKLEVETEDYKDILNHKEVIKILSLHNSMVVDDIFVNNGKTFICCSQSADDSYVEKVLYSTKGMISSDDRDEIETTNPNIVEKNLYPDTPVDVINTNLDMSVDEAIDAVPLPETVPYPLDIPSDVEPINTQHTTAAVTTSENLKPVEITITTPNDGITPTVNHTTDGDLQVTTIKAVQPVTDTQ